MIPEKFGLGNVVWLLNEPESTFDSYSYNSLFTKEECEKIIAISDDYLLSDVMNGDSSIRNSSHYWIYPEDGEWIYRKIVDVLFYLNNKIYNYKLNGIEALQLTKYKVGDYYNNHIDVEPDSSSLSAQRKLSFIIQLSEEEDYEGGNLILHGADLKTITQKSIGSITLFPSYRLHNVSEVTKGVRYSLVGWTRGPSFV
tara:strand:- start:647 stop:1240 length:594 start_codon:yes stop_codon:yes gene_type:complete